MTKDTELFKALDPFLQDWLRVYFQNAVQGCEEVEEGNTKPSFASTTIEDDSADLINAAIKHLFTGAMTKQLTHKQFEDIVFVLDKCFIVARRVVNVIMRGKMNDSSKTELTWLILAHVRDMFEGLKNKPPYIRMWREFENRIIVENLDGE